jgi:hypothetical protein
MSAETKKVLELLTEGKISAEDAEKLLDRLSSSPANHEGTPSPSRQAAPGERGGSGAAAGAKRPRFLRIVVERPGHDHVNLRIPLSLARTGGLLGLMSPRITERLAHRLAEQGIDWKGLAAMNEEDFAEAIESTNIDLNKDNGKKVRIFCE